MRLRPTTRPRTTRPRLRLQLRRMKLCPPWLAQRYEAQILAKNEAHFAHNLYVNTYTLRTILKVWCIYLETAKRRHIH